MPHCLTESISCNLGCLEYPVPVSKPKEPFNNVKLLLTGHFLIMAVFILGMHYLSGMNLGYLGTCSTTELSETRRSHCRPLNWRFIWIHVSHTCNFHMNKLKKKIQAKFNIWRLHHWYSGSILVSVVAISFDKKL